MDNTITVERLVALGMTEDEAARALEAAGTPAAEPVQPEKPTEPKPPAKPEEAAGPEKPAEPAEPAKPQDPKAAPEPETSEEPAAKPAEPETPGEPAAAEAPESDMAAENAALRNHLIAVSVRASALALGVKPERMSAVQRLADTSGVDPTADDALTQIDEAVRKALAEVPELIGAGAVSTGTLGAHPRGAGTPADPFSRGFGSL